MSILFGVVLCAQITVILGSVVALALLIRAALLRELDR